MSDTEDDYEVVDDEKGRVAPHPTSHPTPHPTPRPTPRAIELTAMPPSPSSMAPIEHSTTETSTQTLSSAPTVDTLRTRTPPQIIFDLDELREAMRRVIPPTSTDEHVGLLIEAACKIVLRDLPIDGRSATDRVRAVLMVYAVDNIGYETANFATVVGAICARVPRAVRAKIHDDEPASDCCIAL
jgi:hypothetical protein